MLPAGPLMIEHRLIERAVSLFEKESEVISSTGEVNLPLLSDMVDFMRTYADRCHHGKEEEILFHLLETKDMTEEHRIMMTKLVDDHHRSRALTTSLNDLLIPFRQGEQGAVEEVIKILQTLSVIYPDHIEREDKHFFPVAMKYLSKEECDTMLDQFKEFDSKLIHEYYKMEVGRIKSTLEAKK